MISGYNVTNVHYTLDGADPIKITNVEFDVARKGSAVRRVPQTVKAQLISGGTWFACTSTDTTHWTCPVTSVTVADALQLGVAVGAASPSRRSRADGARSRPAWRGSAPLYIGQPTMNSPRSLSRSFLSVTALAVVAVAWGPVCSSADWWAGGVCHHQREQHGAGFSPRRIWSCCSRRATIRSGDVATYRHPTLGPVIHRIVAETDGRFIFKGDNNTWLDSYQPTQAEMIGKLWVYVPRLGGISRADAPAVGGSARWRPSAASRLLVSVVGRRVPPSSRQRRRQTASQEADHGGSSPHLSARRTSSCFSRRSALHR